MSARLVIQGASVLGETTADLLVGCDGLRSTVRTAIDPSAPPARYVPVLNIGETAEACTPGAGAPVDELPADHVHAAAVEVQGLFTIPLDELRDTFRSPLARFAAPITASTAQHPG